MSDKPTNYAEYLASKPALAQQRLTELVECLKAETNNGKLELKWGKPALVTDGIVCVFAAFKNHISLHPTPSVIAHFTDQLAGYTTSGNTVQFPINDPLPIDLLKAMIKHRWHEQNTLNIGWK